MKTIQERLSGIREQLIARGLDAWIITGTDPHQSEYTPERWATRAWATGFTGSAGTVVVTRDTAGLWTDYRYFIQAAKELQDTGVELFRFGDPGVPDHITWLKRVLHAGARVGMDEEVVSIEQARVYRSQFAMVDILLITCEDIVDGLWKDRPALPSGVVWDIPKGYASRTPKERIGMILKQVRDQGATCALIVRLDDIAWTLDLRGTDVRYNPLFLAYLLVRPDGIYLFTEEERLPTRFKSDPELPVTVLPYGSIYSELGVMIGEGEVVHLAPETASVKLAASLPNGTRIIEGREVPTLLKAEKDPVEIWHIREVHRFDGAAMVRFMRWFEQEGQSGGYDEIALAGILLEERRRHPAFIGESFAPIFGFSEHGALCHYSARPGSAAQVGGDGLIVVDTGGQYLGGTTDITRTLPVGEPTAQQIMDYTRVLKAHVAVAMQEFPKGTRGYQLDAIARSAMWNARIDYGHGTGHGVGYMLNVHEGPQSISSRPLDVPLLPGMLISNEPGIYREGSHGIRIENLVLVEARGKSEFGEFLGFSQVTVCPYERALIDRELLSTEERGWVDDYHRYVYESLAGSLEEEDAAWLREKTLPL